MAFLVECAGRRAATTGRQRILAIQPVSLRSAAVILGSKNGVERVTGYHAA